MGLALCLGEERIRGPEACREARLREAGSDEAGDEANAAKLVRACGGCLGTRRLKGVEDCEKSGGVVKRALIPEYPS